MKVKGGLRQKDDGFTILETIIVLAVTAALFVSAIVMMSGRQRQAEFNTAIRDVQSQLQQTISEVGNGFYPSMNNFTCTAEVTGPKMSTLTSKEQGTNEGCIFLGKVVQFGLVQSDSEEQYPVFSAVGLRNNPGTKHESKNLLESKPKVIAPASDMLATDKNNMPNVTATKEVRSGLDVKWMRINGVDSLTTNIGAVGFMSSLGVITPGNSLSSGSQHVYALPLQGTTINTTDIEEVAKNINEGMVKPTTKPLGGDDLQICIDSGTTDQSGLIIIGGNGRELSVDLRIQGAKCSA